ncbi:MAG: DNA repair exonuclease, partial [Methanothermobacter sp.]
MYRFAHLSDCHLGAQKQPELRELEFQAFRMALDDALENNVDFMIIAGDLFHSNIPNMETVKRATLELRRVRDEGVPIYVNYGSHDYSPSNTSMIDILETAGVIEKVVRPIPGKKLGLEFTVDEKTGAKIT